MVPLSCLALVLFSILNCKIILYGNPDCPLGWAWPKPVYLQLSFPLFSLGSLCYAIQLFPNFHYLKQLTISRIKSNIVLKIQLFWNEAQINHFPQQCLHSKKTRSNSFQFQSLSTPIISTLWNPTTSIMNWIGLVLLISSQFSGSWNDSLELRFPTCLMKVMDSAHTSIQFIAKVEVSSGTFSESGMGWLLLFSELSILDCYVVLRISCFGRRNCGFLPWNVCAWWCFYFLFMS